MSAADRHCVLLAGGYSHPFTETGDVLAMLAREAGWHVDRHEEAEPAIDALQPDTGLFIANALWWSMTQHEKYEADRPQWSRTLGDARLAAVRRFVEDGGALLAVHTAVICWDTQPGWRDLLGGGWRWHHSHHPPMGEARVRLTDAGAALAPEAAGGFTLVDEVYHGLDPAGDCAILAEACADTDFVPVAWLRRVGKGTVAVDALGHDGRSLRQADHRALLRAVLRRAAENVAA
ncbi:hypothetical protein B2G71_17195 [Novosphingobium sp. PC22D]|uniref:ThuA domain-containing protein n=1 Tax=Novosphingobium sp. PC22D TaxID=1962403 RepID=UPI000BF187DE|nr:ThuA domain-containing protein [Novosphingobium sp. PC22D]PEQ11301.1 hypothetical protein B2G71_17195 [Novosphingobium sp. PC22D]